MFLQHVDRTRRLVLWARDPPSWNAEAKTLFFVLQKQGRERVIDA